MSLLTVCFSMYSLMSILTRESSLLNMREAKAFASSVFPTPVGPMKKKLAVGLLGSAKPALDLYNIPEFLRLLHSREVNSETEQRWVLELVKDGLRDNLLQPPQTSFVF